MLSIEGDITPGGVTNLKGLKGELTYQQCIKSIDEGQRVVSKDIVDVDI